jgi:conjugal transfer pilin signal peptidase TrbI
MAMKFLQDSKVALFFSGLSGKEKGVAVAFLAAVLLGSFVPGHFIVSISNSLDKRVFFLTALNRDKIKNGDYLVFKGEAESTLFGKPTLNKGLDRVIKKVGCAPGEALVRHDGGEFSCHGAALGKALETDSLKRPLPQFDFSGTVPADSYFMIGDNPRSFDSKYFGFIHADQMLHKALPLL